MDLNLGCPAPVVYRKCAGGGLLREPARVDAILGALRDAVKITTVKTRIGFDSCVSLMNSLPSFAKHSLDLAITAHGRTVYEMYRTEVHYDYIARAVAAMPCPVLANGNVHSAQKAEEILKLTGAHGLMIGRGAIRNPGGCSIKSAGTPAWRDHFHPARQAMCSAYIRTLYNAASARRT